MNKYVNFRDLGSYETKDGRKIKEGLIFRSGALSRMDDKDKEEFKQLGIKTVLDLRSKKESDKDPDPYFEGVNYLRHSGLETKEGKEIDFSPNGMRSVGEEGIKQYNKLLNYYRNIPFNNESMHVLIDAIKNKEVPIVFHCFSGKDRTGVGAMIVLALLGVDDETIMKDYLLSNEYCTKALNEEFERSKDLIEKDPNIKKLLQMLEGVEEEVGLNVLSSIKEKYGNYDNYFTKEYGIDEKERNEIKKYYLH